METQNKKLKPFELFEIKQQEAKDTKVIDVLKKLALAHTFSQKNVAGKEIYLVHFKVKKRYCIAENSSKIWDYAGLAASNSQTVIDLVIAAKNWEHSGNNLQAIDFILNERNFVSNYKKYTNSELTNNIVSPFELAKLKLETARNTPIHEVLAKLNIPIQKNKRVFLHQEKEGKAATCQINKIENGFFDYKYGDKGSTIDLVILRLNLTGADAALRAADFILGTNDYNETKQEQFDKLVKKASQIPTPAEREASNPKEAPKYKIQSFGGLSNDNQSTSLRYYILARKINDNVRRAYLCKVNYFMNGKPQYGITMISRKHLPMSSARTRAVAGKKGEYTYEKSFKINIGSPDITLIKRIGQQHTRFLIFEGYWDFLAYETFAYLKNQDKEKLILKLEKLLISKESTEAQADILHDLRLLIEQIQSKFHVIILNGWMNYIKAIDYLPPNASIYYCGDNDLINPNKPNDIPRGDFVLQEFQKVFGDAVTDLRHRYAEYSDLNDKLMNKKLSTPKTY